MMNIGLIVNPIAGMGGAVGLKGTDGDMYEKAIDLGAEPVTPGRVEEFLSFISNREGVNFLVAPGKMGEDYIREFDLQFETIGYIDDTSSREDTIRIARKMMDSEMELLVFAGGDGTARDIYDAIGRKVPVIPIPTGVKVFSSVFAVNPRAAARMLNSFLKEKSLIEREVLDIDEDSYREGKLTAERYGYLLVPEIENLLQKGKESSTGRESVKENKKEIARYIIEEMERDTLHLLGPGTTLRSVSERLGVSNTLLGVDAVINGNLVGSDLNEEGILKLLRKHEDAVIWVTPLGGNGFVFGRGNKQFTPEVIKKVGFKNIVVLGNRSKINKLGNLRIDTGDHDVDQEFQGYIEVITGYRENTIMEVKS